MEQLQTIYAHRYVLQGVIYRLVSAAVQYGVCVLLMILGAVAGVCIGVLTVLVFYSVLDLLVQNVFPTGIFR